MYVLTIPGNQYKIQRTIKTNYNSMYRRINKLVK